MEFQLVIDDEAQYNVYSRYLLIYSDDSSYDDPRQ